MSNFSRNMFNFSRNIFCFSRNIFTFSLNTPKFSLFHAIFPVYRAMLIASISLLYFFAYFKIRLRSYHNFTLNIHSTNTWSTLFSTGWWRWHHTITTVRVRLPPSPRNTSSVSFKWIFKGLVHIVYKIHRHSYIHDILDIQLFYSHFYIF